MTMKIKGKSKEKSKQYEINKKANESLKKKQLKNELFISSNNVS